MFDDEKLLLLLDAAQHELAQKTSRRKLPEPLPSDPTGKRLCELFPYRWQPIIAVMPEDCFAKPEWQTVTKYPLRPRSLWNLWQDAACLVGVRFGRTTQYGLIDLDALSNYHPSKSNDILSTIRAALETIGIYRLIIVRSSWNGGLHLYIPLPEAIATFDLAVTLKFALEAQGLPLRQGQLEAFPNVKRFGKDGQYVEYNAHRLPLQPASGSFILNDDLQPVSHRLDQFFQQWDMAAAGQEMTELKQAIATARKQHRYRCASRGNRVDAWKQDLLGEIAEGWTGHGQTNHLLKTIACYGVVFEALTGNALEEYVLETALECPGYQQWCRHQHEIKKRVKDWALEAEGYYWALGTDPKRTGRIHVEGSNQIVPFNRQRSEDAQERIRQAVAQLEQEHELPAGITARMKAIAAVAKCSFSTLRKHEELWHPERCVMPVLEPEIAVEEVVSESPSQTPELAPGKELHTKPYMKGEDLAVFPDQKKSLPAVLVGFSVEASDRSHDVSFPKSDPKSDSVLVKAIAPSTLNQVVSFVAAPDDVIGQIQCQIRGLNWSFEQAQSFIAAKFHGKRRSQLTDDELILLLYYLREFEELKLSPPGGSG